MLHRITSVLLLSILSFSGFVSYAQACSAQDVEAWRTQANNDFDLENYEGALHGYNCMIEVSDEQDAFAYEWRGISKQLMGDLDGAMIDINRSIELAPEDGGTYYSRGNLYLDFDEYELAIEDFTTATNKDYRFVGVYNNRGYAYQELGDLISAKRDYSNAIRLDNEYGLGYSNLGDVNFLEGDLESALANFDLGIQYADDIYRAYPTRNRGTIRYMEQDFLTAIDDYTTAIEANPDAADIYLLRANAYKAIDSPNANADYLRYIQTIQTEIVDLERLVPLEKLEMVEGRVYRATVDVLQSGGLFEISANTINDSEVDTLILLLGPSGTPLIGDDDSGADEGAAIRFRFPEAGTYTVLVTHSTKGDTGEFLLNKGVITYQLAVGKLAQVFAQSNDGTGLLNLREYPSLGFDTLEQLSSGTQVDVVNGPYKDDNFVWWQVQTDAGQVGWVADHINGVQTLFSAIQVGESVELNVFELNLRTEPTTNSDVVRVLFKTELYTVIDGPVEADGFTWWKLRTSDNTEGWVVDYANDKPMLVAVVES